MNEKTTLTEYKKLWQESLEPLVEGNIPPWLRRFIKQTGKGINQFKMIQDADRVLLGISGGKDSLALALALSLRRKWLPIHYQLQAAMVHWREYPLRPEQLEALKAYFQLLDIPFTVIDADMMPQRYQGKFSCYFCARNRKRILFTKAEELGFNKIALGHHMDDIAITTLMNLSYHGKFSTMMPLQEFFDGKIKVIRPLCLEREAVIRRVNRRLHLPVAKADCPFKETNLRDAFKPILQELESKNKYAVSNIFQASWNIVSDYLPQKQED